MQRHFLRLVASWEQFLQFPDSIPLSLSLSCPSLSLSLSHCADVDLVPLLNSTFGRLTRLPGVTLRLHRGIALDACTLRALRSFRIKGEGDG